MEEERYWKQFVSSGRVEDYLAYRDVVGCDTHMQDTDRDGENHERHRDSDWHDRPVITNQGI